MTLVTYKMTKTAQMKLVNSTFNSGKVMNENMGGCFPCGPLRHR